MTSSCTLRTSRVTKPRKITACMSPGFHSRFSMRDCRKPLTSTVLKRVTASFQRISGPSATTIASLRQASAQKPASAAAKRSVIATGLRPSSSRARRDRRIHVEELQASCLQTLGHHREQSLHEKEAELRVLVARIEQSRAIEGERIDAVE